MSASTHPCVMTSHAECDTQEGGDESELQTAYLVEVAYLQGKIRGNGGSFLFGACYCVCGWVDCKNVSIVKLCCKELREQALASG